MSRRRKNTQMFALSQPPPATIETAGTRYKLILVFKHDFYAATCLYESLGPAEMPKIVVKFGRCQRFCGLDTEWLGRFFRSHEQQVYAALAGIPGVPGWVGYVGRTGYAIEYVDGRPLDHPPPPPKGFFDRLKELFDAVHARGVAYCDANKRSNILIGRDGRPFLIDYQISFRRRSDWPWPFNQINRKLMEYFSGKDLYHIYKHKRRISPGELTAQEEAISRHRSGLHLLHRKLTKPYRAMRRKFLQRQYQSGRLISPTAKLENHFQPEKATWRKPRGQAK